MNLEGIEAPKMPSNVKVVETVNAGPPPGHPNTATSCLWYILSPLATPFLHFFQQADPYCAHYEGQHSDDDDDISQQEDGDKDEGSIVDRCSANFFARRPISSDWKKEEPKKPVALKDLPLWSCFCTVFNHSLGPYFTRAYSKMDRFFYCSRDDDDRVGRGETCSNLARKQPQPERVCAEEATGKADSGEMDTFKVSNCNLSRMAHVIQVHLYNLSFSTDTVCPSSDSPFFKELRMLGSPAAELPPKALAQTVQHQLADFVTTLDKILDISEGRSVASKSGAEGFSVHSSGEAFMTPDEIREQTIRNALLLQNYS